MSTPDRGADESGPHLRYVPAGPVLQAIDVTLQRAARVRSTGVWVFAPTGLALGLVLSWVIAGGGLPLAWLQGAGAASAAALLMVEASCIAAERSPEWVMLGAFDYSTVRDFLVAAGAAPGGVVRAFGRAWDEAQARVRATGDWRPDDGGVEF